MKMFLLPFLLLLSIALAEPYAVVYATIDASASQMLASTACRMINVCVCSVSYKVVLGVVRFQSEQYRVHARYDGLRFRLVELLHRVLPVVEPIHARCALRGLVRHPRLCRIVREPPFPHVLSRGRLRCRQAPLRKAVDQGAGRKRAETASSVARRLQPGVRVLLRHPRPRPFVPSLSHA